MSAAVTYMIEATTDGEGARLPCTVQLPVRRAGRPQWREAARLIRAQFPAARAIRVRRSAVPHLSWAASGIARRENEHG